MLLVRFARPATGSKQKSVFGVMEGAGYPPLFFIVRARCLAAVSIVDIETAVLYDACNFILSTVGAPC